VSRGPEPPAGRDASGLSRRGLIGSAAAGGALALAGAGAMAASASPSTGPAWHTVPFHGERQAGITTAAQDRLHFATFDLVPSATRDDLVSLLRDWTAAAERMTRGLGAGPSGPLTGPYDTPPDDTGEAIGLDPAHLTITFGFGPTLFTDAAGTDRFGLASRRPEALARLPHFAGDKLDRDASDGDLCVQACSDDPQVAVHAIRNLTRIAFGRAAIRWSQLGFGRTSSTAREQVTARNLFGFKDGTASLRADDTANLDQHVWTPPSGDARTAWLDGGSYLVARKIAMHIETWDRGSLREQERIIGRTKAEGAPLSGGGEFTPADFARPGRGGAPLVDESSHLALAHPDRNRGVRMLRRGYNYVDGSSTLGRLAAGLFFIAYVTDPRTHYIPMQTAMASTDLLSEYLQHIGSGLWAVPPGVREGGFVGEALLG
jgi:deferrochelatase/peroxidase EfeB